MNAKSLNEKIEQLSRQKALNWQREFWSELRKLSLRCWPSGKQGNGTYCPQAGVEILTVYADRLGKRDTQYMPDIALDPAMVDEFRTLILDEILEKVPLIEELARLRDELPELQNRVEDMERGE